MLLILLYESESAGRNVPPTTETGVMVNEKIDSPKFRSTLQTPSETTNNNFPPLLERAEIMKFENPLPGF